MWLTPHPRDLIQPEGERERSLIVYFRFNKLTSLFIVFAVYNIAVDGRWSVWSDWSACSRSCDSGIKTRSRDCTQPPPQHGGQACEGDAVETVSCSDTPCPGKSLIISTHLLPVINNSLVCLPAW